MTAAKVVKLMKNSIEWSGGYSVPLGKGLNDDSISTTETV